MLPVIKILLFKDTPLRPNNATGRRPDDIQVDAPSTRVSVEDIKSGPETPPVTKYT